MNTWKEVGKIAALFMLCLMMGAVTAQVMLQPKLLSTAAGSAVKPALDETTGAIRDMHSSITTIKGLTAEIKTDYENNQENMAANSEAAAVLIRSLTDTVTDTHTQLFGGKDCRPTAEKLPNGWAKLDCKEVAGLFPQTGTLLSVAKDWMVQLKSDTHDLMQLAGTVMKSTDDALKPLKSDLEKLGVLEDDLDQAIKSGGAHVDTIMGEIETTIASIDARLQDPNIEKIVANLSKTTYHFGEVAQTTDIATRGLREKLGKVKWVIQTLSNYIKATLRIY